MLDVDGPLQNAQHRILVVDDDADWRESLRFSLEQLGYRVDEAGNGPAALEALERAPYAVVLLDHYMPGMTGEEVLRRLPACSRAKVVLVTGARADEVRGALSRGPFYYLPKGAGPEHLDLLLRSLVL
jgi:CheY-like chemotaxis protein